MDPSPRPLEDAQIIAVTDPAESFSLEKSELEPLVHGSYRKGWELA